MYAKYIRFQINSHSDSDSFDSFYFTKQIYIQTSGPVVAQKASLGWPRPISKIPYPLIRPP